jgi:hypothetical protein
MRDFRQIVAAALAAPLCAVIVSVTAVMLIERGGGTLFAARVPANLAEAAASGRADLVVRYLRSGQQPSSVYAIHPDVISSAVLEATALEAAIWSRQVELIELLDREGAIPHGTVRPALACLATDLGAADIVQYLTGRGDTSCVPEQALSAVMARTARAVK